MMSFKQFLIQEATDTKTGNYVAVKCKVPSKFTDIDVSSGQKLKDYHITIVYLRESTVDKDKLLEYLNGQFKDYGVAKITKAAKFDSDKDNKSCIVLKLQLKQLNNINAALVEYGDIKHSYPTYEAHVSLFYDVNTEEAEYWVDKLNMMIDASEFIEWKTFESRILLKIGMKKL